MTVAGVPGIFTNNRTEGKVNISYFHTVCQQSERMALFSFRPFSLVRSLINIIAYFYFLQVIYLWGVNYIITVYDTDDDDDDNNNDDNDDKNNDDDNDYKTNFFLHQT